MCGVIGYCGSRTAADIIYGGLERLEYRGYDSAGIATQSGGKIFVAKKRGRVSGLKEALSGLAGTVGVGHTRWATHGKPSDRNAHPHEADGIVIVHNGIIENYAELKADLEKRGARFSSDTDSEAIAWLIREKYSGDLLKAVAESVNMLKGSYALMAMRAGDERIVAARCRSPLVAGSGADGNYLASDLPALAGVCDKICLLEEGDFAVVTRESVDIFDKNLQKCDRGFKRNPAPPASVSLCGFPHFMLKELTEAPEAVERTARSFEAAAEGVKAAFCGAERVILLGCGTAYNAALVGKRYFEEFCRIPAEAEIAGEFRYKRPIIGKNCAVFAVSQSGETADTVEAARLASSLGARVFAVTNSPYSQLARLALCSVPVTAGDEICVAATKSYSAQVAALYLTARMLSGKYGDTGIDTVIRTAAVCRECLSALQVGGKLEKIAEECADARGVFFLGRGLDFAAALEGSLKMKEVSYVRCEGYPAGELKHGTLALVDGRTVCAFICTDMELYGKCRNAVDQVTSRGGKAVIISPFADDAENVLKIPACDALLGPLVAAGALQLLAYRTAVFLGRDPDKPRNLAKSVTVE